MAKWTWLLTHEQRRLEAELVIDEPRGLWKQAGGTPLATPDARCQERRLVFPGQTALVPATSGGGRSLQAQEVAVRCHADHPARWLAVAALVIGITACSGGSGPGPAATESLPSEQMAGGVVLAARKSSAAPGRTVVRFDDVEVQLLEQ